MQQLQLGVFVAAMIVLVVCGCILRRPVNIAKLREQFDLDQITSFCDPL
jgi:hypothetical protein